jgi:hypothetical protein
MKINITLNPNVPKSQLHDPRVISGLAAVAAVTFGPEAGNLADKTLEFGVINQAGAFSVQFPKAGCMGRSLFRGDEEAVKTLTSKILDATEDAIHAEVKPTGGARPTLARQCELDGGSALAALMAELEAMGEAEEVRV